MRTVLQTDKFDTLIAKSTKITGFLTTVAAMTRQSQADCMLFKVFATQMGEAIHACVGAAEDFVNKIDNGRFLL